MGVASLVGAVVSPGAGWLGDHVGYRPILLGALVAGGVASLAMPAMPALGLLAVAALALGAAVATTGAMVFSMLATEVPPERRSTTLNLVYLPLYIAGIVGPALGGGLAAAAGAGGPFIAGGLVFLGGAAALALRGAPHQAVGVSEAREGNATG
jgi:MFS family permease